jgi:predicted ATPase
VKFQIDGVVEHGRRIKLSRSSSRNENVYTMLVGRNATGKSRLLGKIANHYIFQREDLYHSIDQSHDSISQPSQVIVISNSRYDKFPDPIRTSRDREGSATAYHYLAGGSERYYSPYKILSASFETAFDFNASSKKRESDFFKVLDYIGFLPACSFEIRRAPGNLNREGPWSANIFDREAKNNQKLHDYENSRETHEIEALLGKNRSLTIRVDLNSGWNSAISEREFSLYVPKLIKTGHLKLSKITLYDRKTKDKVHFHQASSGQQCMLLLFLGLSGVMANNSLVCIDEPEISLHPKWQAEFIGLLQEAFSHYTGCHFLIATHSPQVVSGLTSSNGFVADLENGELFDSSEYAKRSADFQLSEIFHEPGFKNEYIIRKLLVMLSKLSKGDLLTDDDHRSIKRFESLRDRIDEADPVLHLLDQVKMMV